MKNSFHPYLPQNSVQLATAIFRVISFSPLIAIPFYFSTQLSLLCDIEGGFLQYTFGLSM